MQEIKTYPSGLRLVVENMPGFTSVSFNIYVSVGSMMEDETNQGVSHLIEHMLFKGTKKRSAFQIADDLKNIGAQSNAFTSREETCFYARLVADYIEDCVEIYSDMFFNSAFDEKELKREKNVVIEEIQMYKDDPSSVCAQMVDDNFYAGCPFSSNIIGTIKSVKSLTREQIKDYMAKNYVAKNVIISFAGNIDTKKAEELVEKYFSPLLKGKDISSVKKPERDVYPQKPIGKTKFKDNAQSEVIISYPSPNRYSDLRYASAVFNVIWGSSANMSSRLFQSIREKKGLVYRIYSSACSSDYGGDMSIGFSTSAKNVAITLKAIKSEIDKLIKHGVTTQEFESAKVNIYTSSMLRYESTSHISLSNARELAIFGKIEDRESFLNHLKNVSMEDIEKYIDYTYNNDHYVIGCVGKDKDINLLKEYNSKK